MAHLKGQNVNIYKLTSGSDASAVYDVLAQASTSCDFSVTANTADGASKSDADAMWDNPIFTYCDWSLSNESFIVSLSQLNDLLKIFMEGKAITVAWNAAKSGIQKYAQAVLTSLEIDAPSDDYAKISLSLEGASGIKDVETGAKFNSEEETTSKLRGKTLMIACKCKQGSETTETWKTLCAATSHKLSLSAQTADTKTKDDNDEAVSKEITGFSMTLSSENLIALTGDEYGITAGELLDMSLAGTSLPLAFGYYDAAGKDVVTYQNSEDQAKAVGYGGATADAETSTTNVICTCSALCTSWSQNAANKEDSSMSAEFTVQGKPEFTYGNVEE